MTVDEMTEEDIGKVFEYKDRINHTFEKLLYLNDNGSGEFLTVQVLSGTFYIGQEGAFDATEELELLPLYESPLYLAMEEK